MCLQPYSTCAGAQTGVIALETLLLDHVLQVDLYFVRRPGLPRVSLLSRAPTLLSATLPLSVGGAAQLLQHPLLSLLIAPAAGHRRPIESQGLEEADDVTVFWQSRTVQNRVPEENAAMLHPVWHSDSSVIQAHTENRHSCFFYSSHRKKVSFLSLCSCFLVCPC